MTTKIAKLEENIAQINLEQATKNLQQEDALLISNRDLSASVANNSFKNFQLHKEISDLEFHKYNEGLVALEVYLDAFDDYLSAKNSYLNSLTRFYQYDAQVYSRK